ncbi:acyltransferase [Flavobacterium maritimum]|uniref:acyltransferase n=1 Tax=Flavobacterium maritimum TaxID=3149042 RepID=UPI0032B4D7CE
MKKTIVDLFKRLPILMNVAAMIYSFPSYCFIKGKRSNRIILKGAFLNDVKIRINGRDSLIKISPEARLRHCLLYVKGSNCKIEIGKYCNLRDLELWIEDDRGQIKIGYRTTIEGGHFAATEGEVIIIGEDCMFSNEIQIRNGDSHSIFDAETSVRINNAQPVHIGNHVWLGYGVSVLKGSKIGNNSIVATGTIVTKEILENSIYAGIPSKLVKKNVNWSRERL